MLIIVILLNVGCPTTQRKYDLRQNVNTFKTRNQTSANKHNSTCGICDCGMHYFLFLLQLMVLQKNRHGGLRSKSPYSVRIQENTDQKKFRISTLLTQRYMQYQVKTYQYFTNKN